MSTQHNALLPRFAPIKDYLFGERSRFNMLGAITCGTEVWTVYDANETDELTGLPARVVAASSESAALAKVAARYPISPAPVHKYGVSCGVFCVDCEREDEWADDGREG